ncbi:Fe-S biogenesis protein NfuA [Candidatus Erwinia haradaeae]|uniref:Fe/S biogenesis protein NfuA n=1 Tax=Candidatus Erwinia haradaeae TaxID=1922217 RepID=A0A451D2N3_9GAMM|nr:Fe-S biogenesis protein NfuA [Candidatus Erwinia haradaeae]VFP79922.1 Fe/S biogenesis protein NfuA [Candidatus Erwinia haradaeae]
MVTITQSAQEHFIQLLSKQEPGTQIRIFVLHPGTYKAECGVSYCAPHEVDFSDIELKFNMISAFIDKVSAPYLKNAEIDYVINPLGSQLTLKAPYARKYPINSNAPLIDQVDTFLQTEINPQLSKHGGRVSIIEITKKKYVILQFSGGCNGCAMVNVTIKDGIEKKLLNKFPELQGVKDVTEHYHGKHSFY